jgi:hypothetical protein
MTITFMIPPSSFVYIEIPFQKLGEHPVQLMGMMHKSIPVAEQLSWLAIDQFDAFLLEFLHGV